MSTFLARGSGHFRWLGVGVPAVAILVAAPALGLRLADWHSPAATLAAASAHSAPPTARETLPE